MSKKYKVTAIGNAIIDIILEAGDDFLIKQNIKKGSMSLIDRHNSQELLNLKPIKITSGGSVANSICAMSLAGNKECFYR